MDDHPPTDTIIHHTSKQHLTTQATSITSVPGKVLISGGYLVLETGQAGISLAVDVLMHCSCQYFTAVPNPSRDDSTPGPGGLHIRVTSPDLNAVHHYRLTADPDPDPDPDPDGAPYRIRLHPCETTHRNVFMECALIMAAAAVVTHPSSSSASASASSSSYKGSGSNNNNNNNNNNGDSIRDTDHILHLQINGDPYFYGMPSSSSSSSSSSYSSGKTGLGSSAAAVSAVVAAVAHTLRSVSWPGREGHGRDYNRNPTQPSSSSSSSLPTSTLPWKEYLHRSAQIAHCLAQGKVGSGFDVATAFYGSCIYRRFRPDVLDDSWAVYPVSSSSLDANIDKDGSEGGTTMEWRADSGKVSRILHHEGWSTMEVTPLFHRTRYDDIEGRSHHRNDTSDLRQRSKDGQIVLGGVVAAGSKTPSLVRAVLQARDAREDAQRCWRDLKDANGAIVEHFIRNRDSSQDNNTNNNNSTIMKESQQEQSPSSSPSINGWVQRMEEAVSHEHRRFMALLRELGDIAGVPIVPDIQDRLVRTAVTAMIHARHPHAFVSDPDDNEEHARVIAGVPGAGGYDAVFAVVRDKEEATAVTEGWQRYAMDHGDDGSEGKDVAVGVASVPIVAEGLRVRIE